MASAWARVIFCFASTPRASGRSLPSGIRFSRVHHQRQWAGKHQRPACRSGGLTVWFALVSNNQSVTQHSKYGRPRGAIVFELALDCPAPLPRDDPDTSLPPHTLPGHLPHPRYKRQSALMSPNTQGAETARRGVVRVLAVWMPARSCASLPIYRRTCRNS